MSPPPPPSISIATPSRRRSFKERTPRQLQAILSERRQSEHKKRQSQGGGGRGTPSLAKLLGPTAQGGEHTPSQVLRALSRVPGLPPPTPDEDASFENPSRRDSIVSRPSIIGSDNPAMLGGLPEGSDEEEHQQEAVSMQPLTEEEDEPDARAAAVATSATFAQPFSSSNLPVPAPTATSVGFDSSSSDEDIAESLLSAQKTSRGAYHELVQFPPVRPLTTATSRASIASSVEAARRASVAMSRGSILSSPRTEYDSDRGRGYDESLGDAKVGRESVGRARPSAATSDGGLTRFEGETAASFSRRLSRASAGSSAFAPLELDHQDHHVDYQYDYGGGFDDDDEPQAYEDENDENEPPLPTFPDSASSNDEDDSPRLTREQKGKARLSDPLINDTPFPSAPPLSRLAQKLRNERLGLSRPASSSKRVQRPKKIVRSTPSGLSLPDLPKSRQKSIFQHHLGPNARLDPEAGDVLMDASQDFFNVLMRQIEPIARSHGRPRVVKEVDVIDWFRRMGWIGEKEGSVQRFVRRLGVDREVQSLVDAMGKDGRGVEGSQRKRGKKRSEGSGVGGASKKRKKGARVEAQEEEEEESGPEDDEDDEDDEAFSE